MPKMIPSLFRIEFLQKFNYLLKTCRNKYFFRKHRIILDVKIAQLTSYYEEKDSTDAVIYELKEIPHLTPP